MLLLEVILRTLAAGLLLALPLRAHSGMETETAVSLFKDRTTIVVRCAPELAWHLLGPKAPRGPLDTAFAAAAEDLQKLAPSLIELESDGEPLKPERIRVELEPDRHVAFVLRYPRPSLPATIKAPFLAKLDALEPAVFHFYDRSTGERTAEPFAALILKSSRQHLRFTSEEATLIRP